MRRAPLFCTADEAVAAIPDGATVAVGGFVGAGHPELLTEALERRFLATGVPRDLTLFYCAGQGDRGERGLNHLAHEGLLKRVIGGHWNLAPKLGALALDNRIEAYNLPQGVLCVLLREIAAKRPGLFTRVGLGTFMEPDQGGGRMNARTTEPLIERLMLDGEPWLRYKPVPVHVGLIRATSADRHGNLSFEREALVGEALPIAQAAKNHGGRVIAQVERVLDSLPDPKAVRVPGILVDSVVVDGGDGHDQTFGCSFNPAYVSSGAALDLPPLPASDRKRIGARALREIRAGDIVNLGNGRCGCRGNRPAR
jgi:propionate CoA-transferase